jgi:adenylate cyclase
MRDDEGSPRRSTVHHLGAGYRLDLGRGCLLGADGAEVPLRRKAFEVLRHLAENAGRLVGRGELMQAVWPGVYVNDDSASQCVAEVRRALGDEGRRLLRTLPGRGYILEASVGAAAPDDAAPRAVHRATSDAVAAPDFSSPHPPLPDRPSLVVLPFANLGGDLEQEYFADGITEELTTALSRVRWFFVIGRGSAFVFKGRAVDLREVGRQLGVRYVLEGSVRTVGGRVRIACQLAETDTGHQVWAERFDGEAADIFSLQDRVAEAVAGAVEPNVRGAEIARARTKKTEDLRAYDLYLRAHPHHYAMTREGNDAALALLRQAVELDPGFGRAKALASFCHVIRAFQGWAGPHDPADGVRLAREALAADRDDPTILQLAARTLVILDRDRGAALAMIQRALSLNPNSADAHQAAGYIYYFLGNGAAAVAHFERALRLSPLDPEMPYMLSGLGHAHLVAGRPEEALAAGEQAVRERPDWGPAHRVVVTALAFLGRRAEAEAAVLRAQKLAPASARVFADRTRALYADQAYAEARIRAMRDVGLPE